jgi:SagB-type dehydrogenase family enzyme
VSSPQTVTWAPWILGDEGVALDDPAETFHEASRISRVALDHRTRGPTLLEHSPELRATVARAAARRSHASTVELPAAELPRTPLGEVVAGRRSHRSFRDQPVSLEQLSVLLRTGYGITGRGPGEIRFRSAPSGGALYPLDLYIAASAVTGLDRRLHHFDPLRGCLEVLGPVSRSRLGPLTPYPEVVAGSSAVVFVTATFWRSRFKYGQRGYRFALLEAGHVAQNLLLAATALGLASVPLGGFFDRQVNDLLEVDGLHEAALYLLPVGHADGP